MSHKVKLVSYVSLYISGSILKHLYIILDLITGDMLDMIIHITVVFILVLTGRPTLLASFKYETTYAPFLLFHQLYIWTDFA